MIDNLFVKCIIIFSRHGVTRKQKLKKEEKDSKDIDKLFTKNKITHMQKRWGTL